MAVEKVAGTEVAVECEGNGTPTLIFVHGLGCDRRDWIAQREYFSRRYRVVSFDLPGHGASPPAARTIEALGRLVGELLARFGQGPAVLIGHSIGCLIILEALRQTPLGVAGVVFLDGGRLSHGPADIAVKEFRTKLDAVGMPTFIASMYQRMFVSRSDPRLREHIIERAKRLDHALALEMMLSAVHWDATALVPMLSRIKVPVLVLQSTYLDENYHCRSLEPGMSTPWTEVVSQHAPHAKIHVVPHVGHFLMIEADPIVNDEIADFVAHLP